jgi:quinol monooxygenase YgiN
VSFTHVVTFQWSSPQLGASSESIAEALRTLVASFEGVERYQCGSDIGLTPTNYDFAVVGTFADRAAFETYRDDPEHQRIIADLIAPILGHKTVVQLED